MSNTLTTHDCMRATRIAWGERGREHLGVAMGGGKVQRGISEICLRTVRTLQPL